MEYFSTVRLLDGEQQPGTYTVVRNPPIILGHPEVKDNLKRIFNFTDNLFMPHLIEYQPHVVEKHQVSGSSFINVDFRWSYNYYHFLTECIPAILEINKLLPVRCKESKFKSDLLRFFEIKEENSEGEMYVMKHIEPGNPSPQKINLIRSVVERKLELRKDYGIIIKRSESYRSVLNHDVLLETAKNRYPIEWKVFDSLSVEDTVTLFSKASVIIAPHGAGLTNMLFSPKGITIIEFMDVQDPNLCYWHLSEMLGNRYFMIPSYTTNSNFIVDDRFTSINI
jgi:capsular polysaccharide biosynthesis protein